MHALVVGSGAREHILADKLRGSAGQHLVSAFGSGNNPGIAAIARHYATGSLTDAAMVSRFARDAEVDFAVIGPEAPLAAGVADALLATGIPVFGPTRDLARIESSKSFARDLMRRHRISGRPRFQSFSSIDGAADFLAELGEGFVVKADGLMGGKGVKVSGEHLASHEEGLAYAADLLRADGSFVLEEKFIGAEFSLFTISDGRSVLHLPPVQDHKRAFEGDTGPNTGGMGSYNDTGHSLPFLGEPDLSAARAINERTLEALRSELGRPYTGVLYGGFMATADGVKVIEFNARFGDPEVMNVLTLFDGDFSQLLASCARGALDSGSGEFLSAASVCKYLVPEGYPDNPIKGFPFDPGKLRAEDGVFLGAVDVRDGQLVGTGSRTVAVVVAADSIASAEAEVERRLQQISGPLFHRPDIGKPELIAQRIELMKSLRGEE